MNPKPSPGRLVHYVLPSNSGRAGEHRAAVMTGELSGPNQNLTVFLDQTNDHPFAVGGDGTWLDRVWSAPYGEEAPDGTYPPGTWHWPEQVAAEKPRQTAGHTIVARYHADATWPLQERYRAMADEIDAAIAAARPPQ